MNAYTVTFQPHGVRIQCRADQAIADAAFEQGVMVPVSCENGVCHICQGQRLQGDVSFANELGCELLQQDNAVLCCVARPTSNVELHMPDVYAPYHKPAVTLACQIKSCQRLREHLWRIELLAPAGKKIDYWPGQYLLLHVVNEQGVEEQVPFTIANAPGSITGQDTRIIELHIANNGDGAKQTLAFLQQAIIARVTLPQGDCLLHPHKLQQWQQPPLLLLAAGTGFSQVKSLVEALLAWDYRQDIHLYWTNHHPDDFYLPELGETWQASHPNLHVHFVMPTAKSNWSGRTGLLYEVIQQDFDDLSTMQVFACGSPNMVYGTLDNLSHLGLSSANMHSDVFAYAPRSSD